MPASPAGFLLPGGQPGSEKPVPPLVCSALAPRFSVAAGDPPRRVHRTWLDTFDWRLHTAGLTLEHHTGRGGGRLVLTDAHGERLTVPAPGLRWPARASALPPGPLASRVAAAAGVRALLPVARGISTLATAQARRAGAETVAWLTLDWTSLTQPATALLPGRISVTAVAGHQREAQRIARRLAAAGLAPASQPQLEAALATAGQRPGHLSGLLDVALEPGMPGQAAMATVLLRLLDTLEANVAGTLAALDPEFLHDLRVAVRRTRTGLKLAQEVLASGLSGDFAAEFTWLGDVTTPARDLDVYLLGYPDLASSLAAAAPAELAPFCECLARRRAAQQRRLGRALRSPRFASLTRTWRDALGALAAAPPPATPTAAELAARLIGRAHRRVIRRGRAITAESPPEVLHDLRKRCKELRYALEFFGSLCEPAAHRRALGGLKGLQDVLGTFQDCQVQQRELRSIAGEMMLAGGTPASALLAMGELAGVLARRAEAARARLAGAFASFDRQDGRRWLAGLAPGGQP
jgi:CHAD domain-containing protein